MENQSTHECAGALMLIISFFSSCLKTTATKKKKPHYWTPDNIFHLVFLAQPGAELHGSWKPSSL